MKIQDVINLYPQVRSFNSIEKELERFLDALYDDRNHDCYVEFHDPDRVSIIEENSHEIEKYEEMRNKHTIDKVFGDTYDRGLLERLISLIEKEIGYDDIMEFDSLYASTTCKIIELLCENKALLANVPLDGRSLELLFKIGKYIDTNLICFEDLKSEIQRFVCENPNIDSIDALYRWFVLRNVTINSAVTAYGNMRIFNFAQ